MSRSKPGVIAKRELTFSVKGNEVRRKIVVQVHLPVEVDPGEVNFDVSPGTASCRVEFNGLDEPAHVAYGADTIQALELALNIDPILRSLKRYEFYFPDGEPYFDSSD